MNTTPSPHAHRTITAILLFTVAGSLSMAIGVILCLTIIGAIVGIPMILIAFACFGMIPFSGKLTRDPHEPPPIPKQ